MIDFNKNLFFRVSKLTCQFEDRDLEMEYQDFRWEKMRNYVRNLLIISEIFNMLIRVDDIRLLGPSPVYIGFHVLGFAAWAYFLFFLSVSLNDLSELEIKIPDPITNGGTKYLIDECDNDK